MHVCLFIREFDKVTTESEYRCQCLMFYTIIWKQFLLFEDEFSFLFNHQLKASDEDVSGNVIYTCFEKFEFVVMLSDFIHDFANSHESYEPQLFLL